MPDPDRDVHPIDWESNAEETVPAIEPRKDEAQPAVTPTKAASPSAERKPSRQLASAPSHTTPRRLRDVYSAARHPTIMANPWMFLLWKPHGEGISVLLDPQTDHSV